MGQSGFAIRQLPTTLTALPIPQPLFPYIYAVTPPYKGMFGTILGMTWARAAIFYGSDRGKSYLKTHHPSLPHSVTTVLPPLIVSTLVQCVNQPLVRATISLQNPDSRLDTIRSSIKYIYMNYGLGGLWHGTSAGILKTVPKYCTAVIVKDWAEGALPRPSPDDSRYHVTLLVRSACKSAAAGLAGAVLTNPLDVIRNEMFKTNLSLLECVVKLRNEMGWRFVIRGMGKNMVAVSVPVAATIFFTDALIQLTEK